VKLNLQVLLQIIPDAKCFGLCGNEDFDVFNIAHLKQFESLSPQSKILYFAVYDDNIEDMGWYNKPFDRTLNIHKLSANDNFVFVVDARISDEKLVGVRYIRVNNIYRSIEQICRYVVLQVNPQVIGVTGSVGKTTSTALIQNVLEKKFNCGRIYSKRLTPLTLSSWLVNFIEQGHKVLALEYSMYRKNHIDVLTNILKPDFSVFLNIKRVHLGVSGINTLNDIVMGKRALIDKSRVSLLNIDNPLIAQLKRKGDFGFSLINAKADAYISIVGGEVTLVLNYTNQTIRFVPYIKTSLFYYQTAVAGFIGAYMGVSVDSIVEALESFRPAENRINWLNVLGQRVLFDGDVTASGRISSLSEHHYQTSILLIHSFDFGEEDVDLQVDDFNQVFSKFEEVRVLDTEENRMIVSRYSFRNITFSNKNDFLSDISRFEFKILHFAIYFRKHKDLGFLMNFITT
jgi:hypothetical protein